MQTYSTFAELVRAMHERDVRMADNLRRSAPLRAVNPRKRGTGPAVAR